MDPPSSTAIVLEQRVVLVVGARGRTKTAQGHVEGTVEWVEGSEVMATGLVPGLACQPSSTIVGSERLVMVVGLEKKKLGLSNDEDASGDESGCGDPKRWTKDVGSERECSKRCGLGGGSR